MPILVTELIEELDLGTSGSGSGSKTISAGAQAIIIGGSCEDTSSPKTLLDSMTWNGVALSEVSPAGGVLGAGSVRSQQFYLNAPATGTQTLAATVDNAANKGTNIVGIAIDDSLPNGAQDQVVSSGSGTAVTGISASGTIGGLAVMQITFQAGAGTITKGADETIWFQQGVADATYALITKPASATTTFNTTWQTSQNWSAIMATYAPTATGPAAPTSLAKLEGSDDTQTSIGWTNGEAYTSIKVHRSTSPGFTPGAGTEVTTLTGAPIRYNDSTAPVDTQLYYVIEGVTAAGSAFSNELSVYTPPAAPTSPSATAGPSYVTLAAVLPTAGSQLLVLRDDVPAYSLASTDIPYNDTVVETGTEYTYRYAAIKNGRMSSLTSAMTATPTSATVAGDVPFQVHFFAGI